jgi:hypothetical protein
MRKGEKNEKVGRSRIKLVKSNGHCDVILSHLKHKLLFGLFLKCLIL